MLVFCDKVTGQTQFSTEESQDAPERVAGLVAVQCLTRGIKPDELLILRPAEPAFVNQVGRRAGALIQSVQLASNQALSPRQREILVRIVQSKVNKEIASELNITVRTVKFHVSDLLAKFGVENRKELARRASGAVTIPPIERSENAQ